jgi:cobalt-zinc-cadmium resistance protein CzcA
MRRLLFVITCFFFLTWHTTAQERIATLEEVIALALERNPAAQEAALNTEQQTALKRTAFEIPKTDVSLLYGQYNSIQNNDNNITISQTIPFPTVFARQHAMNNMLVRQSELRAQLTRSEVTFQVKKVVNKLMYLKARQKVLVTQDSILVHLVKVADVQYRVGESTLLGKTIAETQRVEMRNYATRNEADIQTTIGYLQLLTQAPEISGVSGDLEKLGESLDIDSINVSINPTTALAKQSVIVASHQKKVEAARMFPDLRFGYFNQTLIGFQNVKGQEIYYGSDKRFQGFQLGISFPLLFAPHSARIKAADIAAQAAEKQEASLILMITQQYSQTVQELNKNRNSLEFLSASALVTADLISEQSRKSFESGELDYATLLSNLRQALSIREQYLLALYEYNSSIITLQYLNGNK